LIGEKLMTIDFEVIGVNEYSNSYLILFVLDIFYFFGIFKV